MKAIKDKKAAASLRRLFPKQFKISVDDGNVHVNVPEDFDPLKVVGVLDGQGWCDKPTTDGGQVGCVCVHGAGGFFKMLID